jgi:YD repeat-containing protein
MFAARVAYVCALIFGGILSAQAQPTIPFKSREVEEGKNYIKRLTSTLTVGEASGQVSYAYPIAVPAGRGVTPTIELQYSSSGGFSEYGWGWELTVPMIERVVQDWHLENGNPSNPKAFRYRNGHHTADLERVADNQGDCQCFTLFRERRETTFNHYLYEEQTDSWRILTPSGLRFDLGTTPESRTTSSFFPPFTDISYAWRVTRISDRHGNHADYSYSPWAPGLPYVALSSIEYNGNTTTGLPPTLRVDFSWVPHWSAGIPWPISYRSGYTRTMAMFRLASIVVHAPSHDTTTSPAKIPAGAPTSRTYTFTHTQSLATDRWFHLLSAQVDSFPPVTFEYSTPPSSSQVTQQVEFTPNSQLSFPVDMGMSETDFENTTRTRRVLVDLTSDGRPDLLDATACGEYIAWINTGSGFSRHVWPAVAAPPSAEPDRCSLRTTNKSGGDTLTTQDLFDLDGDAYPDLVYLVPNAIFYCPGTGAGFDTCRAWPGSPPNAAFLRKDETVAADPNFTRTVTDLVDVNGDGLVDSVTASASSLFVRLNRGPDFGFVSGAMEIQAPSCVVPGVPSCIRLTQLTPGNPNRRLWAELRDINGDQIPDFVINDPSSPSDFYVAYGRFGVIGFFGNPVAHYGFHQYAPLPAPPLSLGAGHQASGGDYTAVRDLVDVNGDGLADFVVMSSGFPQTLSVHLNLGGGAWESTARTFTIAPDSPPPLKSFVPPRLSRVEPDTGPLGPNIASRTFVVAQFTDMNGDGIPDFASSLIDPPQGVSRSYFVRQLDYAPPRKLLSVFSLSGNNVMSVSYKPVSSQTPYALHVIDQLTKSRAELYPGEPLRNRFTTTQYAFSQGTFDRTFRTFTAFRDVVAVGDFSTTSISRFQTDYARAGLQAERVISNNTASGVPHQTLQFFTKQILGPFRTYARLDAAYQVLGLSRTIGVTYDVRDAFGAVTNWTELGDPADPADNVIRAQTYITSVGTSRVLHLPLESSGFSVAGGPLPRERHYYDELPLGLVTNGVPSKIERERDATVFVARQFSHDANGNLVSELDELGAQTTYAYDPTHALHRVVTTDPIGTIHRSYNTLTGEIADECGYQFVVIGVPPGTVPLPPDLSWRCSRTEVDGLGRITKRFVPKLDTTYSLELLASVTYEDNVYPLRTTVTKRGVARTIEYRDGFGNPTELRVEETPNQFRVYETAYDAFGRALRSEEIRRENGIAFSHVHSGTLGTGYLHDYVHDSIEQITHPHESNDPSPAVATRLVEADRVRFTDEDGRVTHYLLDHFGRVSTIEQHGAGTGPVATTQFFYNTAGEITRILDPNSHETIYSRNLLGWLTGTTTPTGAITSYVHNHRGQVISTTDPRGVTITHSYDTAGRLTGILSSNEPPGVRPVAATLSYYGPTDSSQQGWLKSETSDGIRQTYTYTAEGAVATHEVTRLQSPHTGTASFVYLPGSLLLGVAYPDGLVVRYVYNLDDSISEIWDSTHATLASFLYEDDGQPSVITNDFGLDEAYGYDVRRRRTSIVSTNLHLAPQLLVDDTIQFSKASLVTQLSRAGLRPGMIPRASPDVDVIQHDYLARVIGVQRNGAHHASYAYDLGGKLLTFNETDTPGSSLSLYNVDRLERRDHGNTRRGFSYDLADNVIEDVLQVSGDTQKHRFHQWDALNRYTHSVVVNGGATEYFYSASGELTRVNQPGELPSTADNLYIGKLARMDMSSGTWTNSILANGKVIGEWTGPRYEMPHRTLQDTVAAVTNDLGQVVRQEEFRPYGSRLEGTPGGRFEQHFHGIRVDELMVAGGRSYAADAGIWLTRDRLVLTRPKSIAVDSRHAHMYGFNFGDPYAFRDPSGASPIDIAVRLALSDDPPDLLAIHDGLQLAINVLDPGWHLSQSSQHTAQAVVKGFRFGMQVEDASLSGIFKTLADNPNARQDLNEAISHAGHAIGHAVVGAAIFVATRGRAGGVGFRVASGGGPARVPYKRPSNATTQAQRDSVQGKPCVTCGAVTPKQFADHKTPLVKEHYQTGSIDRQGMRSLDAVQAQCPTCSHRQGADMSRYSRAQRKQLEEE